MQQTNQDQFNRLSDSPLFSLLFLIIKTLYFLIASIIVPFIPRDWVHTFLRKLVQKIYPAQISGIENIPETQGALIISNRISIIDGIILQAYTNRKVHFLVAEKTAEDSFVKLWLRHFDIIPLVTSKGIRTTLASLRAAGQKIKSGELVCVFPEGHVSRIAALLPFRKGMKTILKGVEAPLIPVYIDGLWGSIFSHYGGKLFSSFPLTFKVPIRIAIGKPICSNTSTAAIRQKVTELGTVAWNMRKENLEPIHRKYIRRMRAFPLRQGFGDYKEPRVARLVCLIKTVALTRTLAPLWKGQENVGIMVPTSPGATFANVAASILGKTSVNLNCTAGRAAIASAIRQAQIKTVITAKAVEAKFGNLLPETVKVYYLEEIAKSVTWFNKILALIAAICAPINLFERICGAPREYDLNKPLTIIFSSGSTGDPKGAKLTHFNLTSNVEQVAQYIKLNQNDLVLNILPIFHSFGYLGMWVCLCNGFPAIFHPNPLDSKAIGEICETMETAFLFATPTFLQLYHRKCKPEQFGTIKTIITGAEKLQPKLAAAFEKKFGVKPVEGYGTTECSPVVSINIKNVRGKGLFQMGTKEGTVGLPLPGMAARILDPETFEPKGLRESGLLFLKGPNIMDGYLRLDDLNKEILKDGWYNTGDIAFIDEKGFITITDRLSRFSKLAGEMVPHGVIELALHEAANTEERLFAVTGIPDDRKGEIIAVLHTVDEEQIPDLLTKLVEAGLPNLYIPKKDYFLKVKEIPVLGTGKLNLKRVKDLAIEYFCGKSKFR